MHREVPVVAPDHQPRPATAAAAGRRTTTVSSGTRASALLRLQRTAGNAAVAGLVVGSGPAAGGGGPVAQRSPGDLGANDLLLQITLAGTTVSWDFPVQDLDRAAVDNLRADPAQIAAIETKILDALRDDAGPVHESPVYLQSPPVADDLRRDIGQWPTTRTLPRFTGRIAARAAAVRNTKLRYPLEQSLGASGTLQPGEIDWKQEVAALRGHPPGPNITMIDTARADRFELALTILEREADAGPPPAAGLAPHAALLGPIIYAKYAATDPAPSELATDEMMRTHSEAFLAAWLPTIRDVRFVPDDFDISAFVPTGDLDAVRAELLKKYVAEAAPRTMEKFLLDRWAGGSNLSPEQYIRTADISALRGELLDHLADDFGRWAVTQPGFRGAFWNDVGQRAAFKALQTLVVSGRALQRFHATLADRFATTAPGSLDTEEYAIAKDPYGYSQKIAAAATVTNDLVSHLKPGDLLEHGLTAWYDGIAAAWSVNEDDAHPVVGLLALFQALGGLKSAVEAQRAASRAQISQQLDVGYDAIAAIIRNEAKTAEEFINSTWIPMLKTVALEQITNNRDEMKEHLANWPRYRAEAAAKYSICAHVLDDLVTRFNNGDIDSVEMDGSVLTKANVPELEQARDFMRGEADMLSSPSDAAAKKDDIQESIDGFEKVRERILDGEYKPVDYAKAVYVEARKRLGIAWYEDWTTMRMALDRWAVVPENPFLAYAIARWQWDERVKQLDHEFTVFLALGLLTVASVVVPGAAGVVLGGLDMAVGIAQGIGAMQDAEALLDIARLDTDQTVRGVTVEQARHALHTAWIGLGLNILLTLGIGALWTRLVLKGRNAANIPADLARLSALARVNPVAAEKMIAKVKDLAKLEELLGTTGDSLMLERMLDRTADVRHLEFALLYADAATIDKLLIQAGDAGTLDKILEQVPDVATAGRLLDLSTDADGIALLLRSADNAGTAEALLTWTGDPRLADQLIGLAGDQAGLLKLSRSGLSPQTAAACLPKVENAEQLATLVSRMDRGPEQIGTLLGSHTATELKTLLDEGLRPSEVEMGVGTPAIGPQPTFPGTTVPLPPDVKATLTEWGIADKPMFARVEPFEVGRLRQLKDARLSKKVSADVNKKAIAWAVDGARGPGDFVDRWDFLKVRLKEIRANLNPAHFPGQNLDNVAATQLTAEAGIADLNTLLRDRAATLEGLAGIGWADLGAPASPALVRANATRLTFGSDVAGPYHVDKHIAELALAEAPPAGADFSARAAAYVASARRTIAEGRLVSTGPADGATRMVFSRTVQAAGDQTVTLDTIVIARERWALIASHGKTMRR